MRRAARFRGSFCPAHLFRAPGKRSPHKTGIEWPGVIPFVLSGRSAHRHKHRRFRHRQGALRRGRRAHRRAFRAARRQPRHHTRRPRLRIGKKRMTFAGAAARGKGAVFIPSDGKGALPFPRLPAEAHRFLFRYAFRIAPAFTPSGASLLLCSAAAHSGE